MQKASVVIGAGYGDEGKGKMVDYLSYHSPNATVVRFNGGCQAGHTVVTPTGDRHVFHHFSSGAFVGNETYLSKFFVINPMIFMKEHKEFVKRFGIFPKVTIDAAAVVTTPYEMLSNQKMEKARGTNIHGSCGVGFGETIERELLGFHLRASFIYLINPLPFFHGILKDIREKYIPSRIDLRKVSNTFLEVLNSDLLIDDYMKAVAYMKEHTELQNECYLKNKELIFEGAQGLLLDQDYGYFPHVTRSNTGMRNVRKILGDAIGEYDLSVYYLTRAYTTRHGAGPINNEIVRPDFVIDKTNITNEWQGSLRYAPLDMDLFNSVSSKDFAIYAPRTAKKYNVVTCVDQIPDNIEIMHNGKTHAFTVTQFEKSFEYVSTGSTRNLTIEISEK